VQAAGVTAGGLRVRLAAVDEQLTQLEKEARRLSRGMEAAFELHQTGQLSAGQFGERYGPLQERFEEIKGEISRLNEVRSVVSVDEIDEKSIRRHVSEAFDKWSTKGIDEQRAIVEAYAAHVDCDFVAQYLAHLDQE